MSYYYVLNADHSVTPVEFSPKLRNEENRRVVVTNFGLILVSTVFLVINHQWDHDLEPLLFETMVFGGVLDGEQQRYSTWDEAIAGHVRMAERVRDTLPSARRFWARLRMLL